MERKEFLLRKFGSLEFKEIRSGEFFVYFTYGNSRGEHKEKLLGSYYPKNKNFIPNWELAERLKEIMSVE